MFGTQLENLAFLHLQHGKREMQSKRHKSIPPSLQPTEGLVAWSGKCAAVIGQWMSLRSHWCLESPTTSYHVGSCRVTLVISTEDCNLRTAQPEANLPVNVGKLAFAIKSLLGHKLVNWLYLLLWTSGCQVMKVPYFTAVHALSDGPVGDPGRCWPPASGGGPLLCGRGDRGGHPELRQIRSQPLCSGKKHRVSSVYQTAACSSTQSSCS